LLLAGGLFNVPRTKKLLTARFEVQILGEEPKPEKDCPAMVGLFIFFNLKDSSPLMKMKPCR